MTKKQRLLTEEDINALNEGKFNRPLTQDETAEYIDSFGTMTTEELLEWGYNKIGRVFRTMFLKTEFKAFIQIVDEFGSFENYILSFFPEGKRIINRPRDFTEIPVSTPISDAISADMKRRDFKFFGTTICYAFLQSAGFVNDHFVNCKYQGATNDDRHKTI